MPGTDRAKKAGGSRRSLASVRSLPLPWLRATAVVHFGFNEQIEQSFLLAL
jgi:hypothetical protein